MTMKWLSLILLLCFTTQTFSRSVYRYVDEKGVVSFTDELTRAQPFDPVELEIWEPDPNAVTLRRTSLGNLYLHNSLHGPVSVTLTLNQNLREVIAHKDLTKPIVVPARTEIFVDQVNYFGKGTLDISLQFSVGTPNSLSSDHSRLMVPFIGRFMISQAFNGNYSHNLPGNRYAIDIAMPEGTPVVAAKSGTVLDMRDTYDGHSTNPADRGKTNYIRLLHADGTMTLYAHLKTNSGVVKPGQMVSAGQIMAQSGNTGYSTGPHLHFAVQHNDGKRLVSIPFELQGVTPTKGLLLASHSKE